jgi:hypothetical protein
MKLDQKQAMALVMYLQRAYAIIPTTGAEWTALSRAVSAIEGVANGVATMEVKSGATASGESARA